MSVQRDIALPSQFNQLRLIQCTLLLGLRYGVLGGNSLLMRMPGRPGSEVSGKYCGHSNRNSEPRRNISRSCFLHCWGLTFDMSGRQPNAGGCPLDGKGLGDFA